MGKDRYSDDHTIEILGDTKTVTLKDNLTVEENLVVGNDATIDNNLNVGNDVSISGSITIAGTITANVSGGSISGDIVCDSLTTDVFNSTDLVITADSIEIDSPDVTFSSIPELQSNDIRAKTYQASKFISEDIDIYGSITLGQIYYNWDKTSDVFLICGISDLPDDATILSVTIAYIPGHIDDQIELFVISQEFGSEATVGSSETASIVAGDLSVYQTDVYAFAVSIDYDNYFHLIRVRLRCGGAGTTIRFYGVKVTYQTKSVGL